jgi:hypothetical protein
MTTTGTMLVRDVVTAALNKLNVVAVGEDAEAEYAEHAMRALNRMLKAWQNRGCNIWATASLSVTLTTAGSYIMSPVRPLRILNMSLARNGIETPMTAMTRFEYDQLPQKNSTGLPVSYYYDRQRENARLYVWPVLSVVDGETLSCTYERETDDITSLNQTLDLPGEYYDAAVYGLAARIADDYEKNVPTILARAEEELRIALAFFR